MSATDRQTIPGFLGTGELAGLIAAFDWSGTSLGPIEDWPPALRHSVALLLRSPVPIVLLWGTDGVMLYNDGYALFAGGRHPQSLGSKVRESWPEIAAFNDQVITTVLSGATLALTDQELTIERGGVSERIWFDVDYSPVVDDMGAPLGTIVLVIETTARVSAQRAAEADREQFRVFAQAMPNHVWAARPDGALDWFNQQVYDYTGAAEASLDGEAWGTVIYPDDLPAAGVAWARALESGETYEAEFRVRRADGDYRWHLARALPIRDPGGAITRWIGTNTDIHARKLAEAAHVRDRDRIWSVSPVIKLISSADGTILAANPSWTRVLGWTQDETVGAHITRFLDAPDAAAIYRRIEALTSGQATDPTHGEREWTLLTRSGEKRRTAWSSVAEGATIYSFGRDITAEVEAAAALAAVEEALRQSQKMEAVGQLTGGIAHDFNNLIQGITGSLEIIQRRVGEGRTDGLDRFIQGATTAAGRAAALTHRLLAFARRQPLDPRPVRVNPLIASIEELLRRTLGEQIELGTVLADGLWRTLCDPNQLENAVLNLAINARDAMPEGGRLTIQTCNVDLDQADAAREREMAPGHYVCICVTDTGAGMSAETAGRAFEPFYTTKPIGQGTGLGLSMIYGFARQSEGHAKIYSALGEGTTVKLYLPRYHGADETEDTLPMIRPARGSASGETVLVIEDEAVVRGLVVEILGELGYATLEASDGPSGLAILRTAQRVALLVTDIGLPGLNGRQVADAARALRPDLKILFMTGYAENAALASGFLERGMSMITKPFAIDALAESIRAITEDGDM